MTKEPVVEYVWRYSSYPHYMKVPAQGLMVRDFALQLEGELGLTELNRQRRRHEEPTTLLIEDWQAPHAPLPGDFRLLPGMAVQVRRLYTPKYRRSHTSCATRADCDAGAAAADPASDDDAPDDGSPDTTHTVNVTFVRGSLAWTFCTKTPLTCTHIGTWEDLAKILALRKHAVHSDVAWVLQKLQKLQKLHRLQLTNLAWVTEACHPSYDPLRALRYIRKGNCKHSQCPCKQ